MSFRNSRIMPVNNGQPNQRNGTLGLIMVACCMLLGLWNVCLHVNQSFLVQDLQDILSSQGGIKKQCIEKHQFVNGDRDERLVGKKTVNDGGTIQETGDNLYIIHRKTRSLDDTEQENHDNIESPESMTDDSHRRIGLRNGTEIRTISRQEKRKHHGQESNTQKKPKAKKKKETVVVAAHFTLDNSTLQHPDHGIDNTTTNQNGQNELFGTVTKHGYVIRGLVFRGWQSPNWTDHKQLEYEKCTGKVIIRRSGTYLVYGQIMFHDTNTNASFGIHINDDIVPFVEAKLFDVSMLTTLDPAFVHDNERSSESGGLHDSVPSGGSSRRPDETSSNSRYMYMKRSTIAVIQLKRDDQVFIKTLQTNMTVVSVPHLTFWGIAQLNAGKL